ncbi:MAG: DUF4445 domain-containing protein [Desulfuromonas sp.]|nr:DUF4445 domain-containing protein [Desulfuromonas sp.]
MASALFLALDLGTTTLAGRLLSADGTLCAEASLFNPQIRHGADVLRRMEAALAGEGEALRLALEQGMAELVSRLLDQAQADVGMICAAAAASNPAISCLLQQLPVETLLFPPHRPPVSTGQWLSYDFLPVPLYLFPLVSGYVGGDLVAVVHAYPECAPGTFFIDVGTNGEMALFNGEQWWVTSVAAGPAFEGGNIACGMTASPGAICGVTLDEDRLQLQTCGEVLPQGLCGSGLVEAIAAALRGGLIDCHGTLVDADEVESNLGRYLDHDGEEATLCLYRDARHSVQLTQTDIRNFQLAKGAVYAGAECLLKRAGMTTDDLTQVVMTGALGFSLQGATLKTVALLPENMIKKVIFSAGGVLRGLERYLVQVDGSEQVQAVADMLRPYPLSGTPDFEQAFVDALEFPCSSV